MYSARDTLLGPIPRGPSDITNLDDESHSRQNVRECLARGEIESVRIGTFINRPWIISDRYCSEGDGVDSLEGYVRSIWYAYYELARLAPYETAEQDRLVLEIVRIQGLGPLTRPVSGNHGIDIARTVEGTLWNDLPFLATDMTDFWINNCGPMSSIQRLCLLLSQTGFNSREQRQTLSDCSHPIPLYIRGGTRTFHPRQ
jgi:hypothetical protein